MPEYEVEVGAARPVGGGLLDPERLALVRRVLHQDVLLQTAFDRVTDVIATALGIPIALVSLVDIDRQHFQGSTGLTGEVARGTPLRLSFCQHVVHRQAPLIVPDSLREPLVADNPAVDELGVAAYAGVPIVVEGLILGSVCAIDRTPHEWNDRDVQTLRRSADLVEHLIGARLQTVTQLVGEQRQSRIERAEHAVEVQDLQAHSDEQDAVQDISRRLQSALLTQTQDSGNFRVRLFYQPGQERLLLGGDFAATWISEAGELHFVIGDVTGHGPEAAALAVSLRSGWRSLRASSVAGEALLKVLNGIVAETDLLATVLVGSLGVDGRARFRSAGHPAPLRIGPGRVASNLTMENGPMLGIDPEWGQWPVNDVELGSDTLFLFTDGLIEGRTRGSADRFGVERVLTAIRTRGEDLPAVVAEATVANGGDLDDDVAILTVSLRDGFTPRQ